MCNGQTVQKFEIQSESKPVRAKLINALTNFIKKDELNQSVKYKKRICTEILEITRVYHEVVPVEESDSLIGPGKKLRGLQKIAN